MRAHVAMLACLLVACSSANPSGPYTAADAQGVVRDSERARELNLEAADLMGSDPDRAETLLRAALDADLFCGPAHNNLGILELQAGNLYEAAHEFEWARKLLPGHPDPRLNLAITLHRARRPQDATEAYEAALEVAPDYVPALQGLARLHLELGLEDERIPRWLRRILMESESEHWRTWAADELAKRKAR